jgi:SAM-dependent methyltransferase
MSPTTPIDATSHAAPAATPRETTSQIHERYLELARGIEGWFGLGPAAIWDALLCFQREQGLCGHMLEIGVWHGKSAALLAMHGNCGERLYLVDSDLRLRRVEDAIVAAHPVPTLDVRLIECDSRTLHIDPIVAECFQGFRWIHVDGEHTARAVSSDLALANMLLAADGIVVVDDFFNWRYPQVTEAVLRHLRTYPDDFALFLCGYNKAYLARPHNVHRYLAYCAERLVRDLAARGIESTVSKTTLPAEMNTFGVGPREQGRAVVGPDWAPDSIRY